MVIRQLREAQGVATPMPAYKIKPVLGGSYIAGPGGMQCNITTHYPPKIPTNQTKHAYCPDPDLSNSCELGVAPPRK